jgi:DNA-binding transcriptional MocR family regulator
MDISTFPVQHFTHISSQPMYLQIAEHIAAAIREQKLPPSAKLPPERQLAVHFDVSRTTAINAYRKLEEWGLISTRIGSGTYVTALGGETPLPMPWHQLLAPYPKGLLAGILRDMLSGDFIGETISMATGMTDPALYPATVFQELLDNHSASLSAADLGHIPTEGYMPLRRELATWLSQKKMAVAADNVAVVSGSQQGLYLLAKIFINPGDYVVVEAPTYLCAIPTFQMVGARILTLPATGPLQLDLLEDYIIRHRPKLLYIMPTFQNPSGRTLSLSDRQALLTLAARHRLIIVEDDPYSEFYYEQKPPLSLKALDTYGGVIYLSTFSKILFPGLRTGWVAAPETVINRLTLEKQYVDLHSANLPQWQLSQYLGCAAFPSHLDLLRREYRKRRDAAAAALKRHCGDSLTFQIPAGGIYFWCRINNPHITSRQLLQEASRLGVAFVPGEAFYTDGEENREFRLCFATHDSAVIHEGIKRLAKALALLAKNHGSNAVVLPSSTKPII